MEKEVFAAAPWRSIDDAAVKAIVAYSFFEERQIAIWLARDVYRGHGAIIDAGAFFGGSALSLCTGLAQNDAVPVHAKVAAVHVFDVFRWAPWIHKDCIPPGTVMGTSFLNVFHDGLREYSEFTLIHPGDISKRVWRLGPIEILFIDCAKDFGANASIMRMFFPSLIPGVSIVNQQDYAIMSRLIWIHAAMEFFWDRFELLASTVSGGTTLFRLIAPITAEDVEACIVAISADCTGIARRGADRYAAEDRRRHAIVTSIESFEKAPMALK